MIDPSETDLKGNAEDFDWVTARHQCSGSEMFNQLRLEAEKNVTARNVVRDERQERENFLFNKTDDKFSVSRERVRKIVDFTLHGDSILVSGSGISKPITATVTLGEPFGFCRLRADGGRELLRWEFLQMALEELFFGKWQ